MITRIEALNFRCLRYISLPVDPFQVLVGPNASGKTTFLDTIAFLGDLVAGGLDKALDKRTSNFQDLVWMRKGDRFELALEAAIPSTRRPTLLELDTIRYEVAIGVDPVTNEVHIQAERVVLKHAEPDSAGDPQPSLFPILKSPPESILSSGSRGMKTVVTKVAGGNDNFYSEAKAGNGKAWGPSFKLGPRRSALGNLPADEASFPVTTWLKELLENGTQEIILNSQLIRKASPPNQGRGFKPDGSNLPWVIDHLKKVSPENFRDWIHHLRTALPDITDIHIIEREDDRHRYLTIEYRGGLRVPSWMASDGTLRLLALTVIAYLPDFSGVYLIEEPENGIHPLAVETMFKSLSSVYDAQILLATHSTVILGLVDPKDVLCFAKTGDGATDIVRGNEHPALVDWRGEPNFSLLFAGGVLG